MRYRAGARFLPAGLCEEPESGRIGPHVSGICLEAGVCKAGVGRISASSPGNTSGGGVPYIEPG